MDGIYLANKFGKPTSFQQWLSVREITDYVCTIWKEKDMSIWEVRNDKQNFVYSKIMLWVAIDRALRLADKRCFPCPQRAEWLRVSSSLFLQIPWLIHAFRHETKYAKMLWKKDTTKSWRVLFRATNQTRCWTRRCLSRHWCSSLLLPILCSSTHLIAS